MESQVVTAAMLDEVTGDMRLEWPGSAFKQASA
jgi:hypothetical protein